MAGRRVKRKHAIFRRQVAVGVGTVIAESCLTIVPRSGPAGESGALHIGEGGVFAPES